MGFFALPGSGAGVWIEFEHGDPGLPDLGRLLVGLAAEVPPPCSRRRCRKVLLETAGGTASSLDDTPGLGGITLETSTGQKIALSATGIEIDNGLGGDDLAPGPAGVKSTAARWR